MSAKLFSNFTLLMAALCFLKTAVGTEGPYTVVIGVLETDTRDFNVLASSVRSQLSDFGATIRIHRHPATGSPLDRPETEATAAIARGQPTIIVHIDETQMEIKIADGKSESLNRRPIPAATRWEDACDASASIIRSVFESWLADERPGSAASKTEAASTEPKPTEEPRVPSPKTPPPVLTPTGGNAHKLSWGMAVDTGYVLQVVSSRYAVLQGGHFGLDMRITRFAKFDVGVDFLQHMRFETNNWQLEFIRWPIRSALSGQWMYRRLTLGGSAVLVVDITRMKGTPPPLPDELPDNLPPDNLPPDDLPRRDDPRSPPINPEEGNVRHELTDGVPHTFWGLGFQAYASFHVLAWLDIDILGGCDLFFSPKKYFLPNGTTVFNYKMAQPRFLAGLTFWLFNR